LSNWARDWVRSDAAAILLLAIISMASTVAAMARPDPVGWWEDDGIYIVTAKSMAEDHGYRLSHLPGEPWQTKYPPLYSGILALIWRAWPEFPANMLGVRALNGILAFSSAWVFFLLARRDFGAPRWMAILAGAIALASLHWRSLIGVAMSEHFYTFLCMSAILMASHRSRADIGVLPTRFRGPDLLRAVLLGVLAAASALTRIVGIALIAAVLCTLVRRRRWSSALVSGGVIGLVALFHGLFLADAARRNANIAGSAAFDYDLAYGAWVPGEPSAIAWVIWNNVGEAPASLLRMMFSLPRPLSGLAASSGPWSAAVLFGALAMVGLILAGMVKTWGRGREAPHLFVLGSVGLALAWPFPPGRFLVPLFPFCVMWLLMGCAWLADLVIRFLGSEPSPQAALNTRSRSGAVVAAVLGGFLLVRAVGVMIADPGAETARLLEQERAACVQMIADNTPRRAVIAAPHGPFYHLNTGRRLVPLFPALDPIGEFYPADRRWMSFGAGDTPGRAAAFARLLDSRLIEYLRTAEATHLCLPRIDAGKPAAINRFLNENNSRFAFIAETDGFRLWRISR